MKIEKLNEDKIRIILNLDDLKEKDIDFHTFMSNSIESQEIFLDMLDEAEKEVGFVTDDYKIMIEALAMTNGSFVLTVTRLPEEKEKVTYKKKKLNFKRKNSSINSSTAIYSFESFDAFCEFCKFLNNNALKYFDSFSNSSSLYEYNSSYYLVFKHINVNSNLLRAFCSSITEFAHFVNNSDLFESKLLEYGNLIISDNAVDTCIEHFVK